MTDAVIWVAAASARIAVAPGHQEKTRHDQSHGHFSAITEFPLKNDAAGIVPV